MFSRIRDSYSFFKLFYNIYNTDFENITQDELIKLKQDILDNGHFENGRNANIR